MLSRSGAVPRHNGAPGGMRITLPHDIHGLATVVSGLSSLFLLVLSREPRTWRGLSIPSRGNSARSLRMKDALSRPKTFTDAPRHEVGGTLPQPVCATAHEMRYADALRLQLRARLLRDA